MPAGPFAFAPVPHARPSGAGRDRSARPGAVSTTPAAASGATSSDTASGGKRASPPAARASSAGACSRSRPRAARSIFAASCARRRTRARPTPAGSHVTTTLGMSNPKRFASAPVLRRIDTPCLANGARGDWFHRGGAQPDARPRRPDLPVLRRALTDIRPTEVVMNFGSLAACPVNRSPIRSSTREGMWIASLRPSQGIILAQGGRSGPRRSPASRATAASVGATCACHDQRSADRVQAGQSGLRET